MSDSQDSERLRKHPRKRFAAPERLVDFDEQFDELVAEAHEGIDGHRQITVAHRGDLTVTLFYFEEGGEMPDHVVDGAVTIQLLEGEVEVQTADQEHVVTPNNLLVFDPGVTHHVRARTESKMLLTVSLED